MKKNTKAFFYLVLCIAIAIYGFKVIFPDFARNFFDGLSVAKNERRE